MTRPGPRPRPTYTVVAHETWANLRSRPWLAVIGMVTALAATVLVILAPTVEVGALVDREEAQIAAGRDVLTVAASEGTLSAARCEGLRTVPGVLAAGGIVSITRERLAWDRTSWVDVVDVTAGLMTIVWPTPAASTAAVAVGSEFTRRTGAAAGSTTLVTDGPVGHAPPQPWRIDFAGGPSSRFPTLDNAIFLTQPPGGPITTCYVETLPQSRDAVAALVQGWFPGAPHVVVSRLVPPGADDSSLSDRIHQRMTAWVPVLAAATIWILTALTWWVRRQDLALYRFLGFTPGHLLGMDLLDAAWTLVLPLAGGALAAEALILPQADPVTLACVRDDLLRFLCLATLSPLINWAVAWPRHPFEAVKGH